MSALLYTPTTNPFTIPRDAQALLVDGTLSFTSKATQEGLQDLSSALEDHAVTHIVVDDKAKRLVGLPGFSPEICPEIVALRVDDKAFTDWSSLAQFPSLDTLELHPGCKDLPEDLSFLPELKHLDVVNARLAALRALPRVSSLRLADAKLAELPPLPRTLRSLTLHGLKKLKTLPNTFDTLPALEEVVLHATSVRALPASLCQHTGLQSLKTEFSNLSKLSGGANIILPSLRVLHLEGRFRKWPQIVSLPSLEHLDLLCWVKELPDLPVERLGMVRIVAPLHTMDGSFAHIPQATITCDEAVIDSLDPVAKAAYGPRLKGVRSDFHIG